MFHIECISLSSYNSIKIIKSENKLSLFLQRYFTSSFQQMYRVSIYYWFFLKFLWFSKLCYFCCSAGVLPTWCVYTHWYWGKRERQKSGIFWNLRKKHPVIEIMIHIACISLSHNEDLFFQDIFKDILFIFSIYAL